MMLPPTTEDRFARIELEHAARERLGAYGLRRGNTISLYGPPGCGKSVGAKRLAWNTGLPYRGSRASGKEIAMRLVSSDRKEPVILALASNIHVEAISNSTFAPPICSLQFRRLYFFFVSRKGGDSARVKRTTSSPVLVLMS